jgi:hypothetical protein
VDKIKVEVEIDLQDLHRYVQTGEDDYAMQPVSLSEAVVIEAARQITAEGKEPARREVARLVAEYRAQMIQQRVEAWIEEALNRGVQRTNAYGEPTGEAVPLSDVIDAEIKKQLKLRSTNNSFSSEKTVLDRVIAENVDRRLTEELNAAFLTAKTAMLNAAQDAGAKAIRAAVAKAVG